MMPLRHQLGTDDDVHPAFGDFLELLAHALRGDDQIARQHQDPGPWEQRCGFLFDALDARPAGNKAVARLAFRTRGRALREEAAVMAHELAAEAVVHQPGVAIWARKTETAGTA